MTKKTLERNKSIASEFQHGVTEEDLAGKYNIGLTYIRTILKSTGDFKNQIKKGTVDRDIEVRKLFSENMSIDDIAIKFQLTPTRIRQIVKDLNGPKVQTELIEAKKKAIDLINKGKSHHEVIDAIGEQAAKRLKYRMNFNIFKLIVEQRAIRAKQLYEQNITPADIAKELCCTRDYVYMLLRDMGVKLKITKEEKAVRDAEIYKYIKEGNTIKSAAEKWVLTETMISIICVKQKQIQ